MADLCDGMMRHCSGIKCSVRAKKRLINEHKTVELTRWLALAMFDMQS